MGGGDDVPYVGVPRGDLLEHFEGQSVCRHQRIPHGADLRRDFGEAFLEHIHLHARGDQNGADQDAGSGTAEHAVLTSAKSKGGYWLCSGQSAGLSGSMTGRTVLTCVPNPCPRQRGARPWTDLGQDMWT